MASAIRPGSFGLGAEERESLLEPGWTDRNRPGIGAGRRKVSVRGVQVECGASGGDGGVFSTPGQGGFAAGCPVARSTVLSSLLGRRICTGVEGAGSRSRSTPVSRWRRGTVAFGCGVRRLVRGNHNSRTTFLIVQIIERILLAKSGV